MTTSKLETVTLRRIREVRAEAEAHRESWNRKHGNQGSKTWQSAVSGCRIVAFSREAMRTLGLMRIISQIRREGHTLTVNA
jgi:hypothetical protein